MKVDKKYSSERKVIGNVFRVIMKCGELTLEVADSFHSVPASPKLSRIEYMWQQ